MSSKQRKPASKTWQGWRSTELLSDSNDGFTRGAWLFWKSWILQAALVLHLNSVIINLEPVGRHYPLLQVHECTNTLTTQAFTHREHFVISKIISNLWLSSECPPGKGVFSSEIDFAKIQDFFSFCVLCLCWDQLYMVCYTFEHGIIYLLPDTFLCNT